jgi:uncharacterized protein
VFACGDITGPPLQAIKAAGEGCTAGLSAVEYVTSLARPADGAETHDTAGTAPIPPEKSGADAWEKPQEYAAQEDIEAILRESRTVAVVGLSDKHESYSNKVAKYLKSHGYAIIPVNPNHQEVLGLKSYKRVTDIAEAVDAVEIFRRSDAAGEIVDDAIAKGAKSVWMQEGVVDEAAAARARAAGLRVVMDRCMYKEHRKLHPE